MYCFKDVYIFVLLVFGSKQHIQLRIVCSSDPDDHILDDPETSFKTSRAFVSATVTEAVDLWMLKVMRIVET